MRLTRQEWYEIYDLAFATFLQILHGPPELSQLMT